MKRLWFATLLLAACGAAADAARPAVPYANAAGSQHAPLYAPAPSPRGVAPVIRKLPTGGFACNDQRLQGRKLSPITGNIEGCGIAAPVRITAVAGVTLTPPIRVNCEAARALADWTEQHAKPEAVALRGQSLVAMTTASSYACRTRNRQAGAKMSEHGKGNAVDISAFAFADGSRLTVAHDWRSKGKAYLTRIWRLACSDFGTVLGPNADKFHQDHFHFDVARYRNGPYCR